MVNAVEIVVGGVTGAAFGSIFDGITELLRNAAEFTTSHRNINSTLKALKPLIQEIEGKNNTLLLQDEELKDLKEEIEAGLNRVEKLSEKSVRKYCMRPVYNKELDGMDKSLQRLLRILQVQGVRDVKEVLVQVHGCKTEIVEGISAWKGKTTDQLDQVASYGEETLNLTKRVLDRVERINGPSGFVPISEKVASLVEEEALGSSLLTMRHAVDEALSKPNPHDNIIFRIEEALRRVVEELGDADENRKLDMGVHEVKWFRIKVEEGTELIRKCSNVVEWTDRKMVKYANKLDDLVKYLEAFGQRENRTEIENEKLIFMKSNPPPDDVNGENRTEIENEMLIFKKSNRRTDDVNGLRNDGKIGHHDLNVLSSSSILAATSYFAEENKLGEGRFGPDDVNGENRTEIENEMLICKKSNRRTDDVNGLRNDGKIGHHDLNVLSSSSILAATSNFAEENKLGEGGFGPDYKGKLAMGPKKAVKRRRMLFFKKSKRPTDDVNGLRNDGKIGHRDSIVFSYSSILAATSNFARENKLGQGGFGPVYKGKLAMGREIAVKRLSKCSGQGRSEFENELILIYELQHTNLVQLFGFCIHGEERMLIYEYLQNNSLDHFLFDPTRRLLLDWKKRFSILEGIAQGLLYLHKYSRKKVIHGDIKASNILLDENMNPKISDFGTARIFTQNGLEADTTRIVGTIGYMAPEFYAGSISVKSDVYSFGVLMLEIISGRKNKSFYNDDHMHDLVGYAWELRKEGAHLKLMDPTLGNSFIKKQLLRCIHVGLLCVQEYAADRPTMADVISMLIHESLPLASPTMPSYFVERRTVEAGINGNQQLETVASANYTYSSDFETR